MLLCHHGVGRFVAPGPSSVLSDAITDLKSVTEMSQELATPVSTRVLSLQEELPDDVVRSRLQLKPEMAVVVLKRIRLAQNKPVISSRDVFPRSIVVGELCPEEFAGSLLSPMEDGWNTRLAYSKTTISAVTLAHPTALPGLCWHRSTMMCRIVQSYIPRTARKYLPMPV